MDDAPVQEDGLRDVIRFSEAIDQAIAESVAHFHHTVERYRNLLLGMLGHDMRSPLNCIVMTASHLASLKAGEDIDDAASMLIRSGASMQALLDDLVDFNRTNLGLGLKIAAEELDLAKVTDEELRQLRAANPKQPIEFTVEGEIRGRWDGKRVQQVVRNLVSNAIRHGSPNLPVRVSVRGDQPDVRIEVRNAGTIDTDELPQLFNPLHQGPPGPRRATADGLGLGLFIVREIARAHGGDVEAQTDGSETQFCVRLPREPVAPSD